MFKSILLIALVAIVSVFYSCADKKAVAETTQINLPSMQCESCVATITKVLKSVEGVESVEINQETKIANVSFDKTKTELSKLETAITKAGYDANDSQKDGTAYNNLPECCKM
ncbi:MAG: copper chaperone [Calditrichaeota bacterium]|nr:MAG: copper chaperone [Calditrichota bacterium]